MSYTPTEQISGRVFTLRPNPSSGIMAILRSPREVEFVRLDDLEVISRSTTNQRYFGPRPFQNFLIVPPLAFDCDTGKSKKLKNQGGMILNMNSLLLVGGSGSTDVFVYDEQLKKTKTLRANDAVRDATFSSSGLIMASASSLHFYDEKICLSHQKDLGRTDCEKVTVSPCGKYLAVAFTYQPRLQLFQLPDCAMIYEDLRVIGANAHFPTSELMVVASRGGRKTGNYVEILRLDGFDSVFEYDYGDKTITGVSFNESLAAVTDAFGEVTVVDASLLSACHIEGTPKRKGTSGIDILRNGNELVVWGSYGAHFFGRDESEPHDAP